MGFLDDLISTTKNVAATAGKKTDEAVQLSKLKIKESQTNNDIKRKYEKLGEMVYQMAKTDTKDDNAFALMVGEIDDCFAKLDEISENIDRLKGEVVCPGCGKKTKDENAYCPSCGTKLPVREEPAEPAAEAAEAPAEAENTDKKDGE